MDYGPLVLGGRRKILAIRGEGEYPDLIRMDCHSLQAILYSYWQPDTSAEWRHADTDACYHAKLRSKPSGVQTLDSTSSHPLNAGTSVPS